MNIHGAVTRYVPRPAVAYVFEAPAHPGLDGSTRKPRCEADPESVRFDGVPLRLPRWYRGATAVKRGIPVDSCVAGVWVTLSKHMNRAATL